MSAQLSAVIITYNAAGQLAECLQSLLFVDEIIILDSGSDDATEEIALQHDAIFIQQDWLGFGPQKQKAVELAKNDWVLCLDADERVSDELKVSIQSVMKSPQFSAYQFPRCNRFMGRWLRHGEGYPDISLRLFDRKQASWSDDVVHECVRTQAAVGNIKGDLLHDSAASLENYMAKQDSYTTLQAENLFKQGKGASVRKRLFNPVFRFVKFYIFRLGLLDGKAGLVHILIGCHNTYEKYRKLSAMYN